MITEIERRVICLDRSSVRGRSDLEIVSLNVKIFRQIDKQT